MECKSGKLYVDDMCLPCNTGSGHRHRVLPTASVPLLSREEYAMLEAV